MVGVQSTKREHKTTPVEFLWGKDAATQTK